MLLVKCKCGCFFTLKEESLIKNNNHALRCINCKEMIGFTEFSNVYEDFKKLSGSGISVRAIPDDARITVTFDA